MESFTRGWSFLQQAWQMEFKDKDLIRSFMQIIIALLFAAPHRGQLF
jgi:hypothetical protein